MKYLKISNWDKWQTYRTDRGTPPWIKVHRNLASNSEWKQLADQEKGQLLELWILAADRDGKIPNNSEIIRKMCGLDSTPDLQRFKDLGFIDGTVAPKRRQPDNQVTVKGGAKVATKRRQGDAPETETETETETEEKKTLVSRADLVAWFEIVWTDFPRKLKKAVAQARFISQIKTPKDFEDIKKALANYILDTEHQRKNGHPDLAWQHGATWFHKNWRDYIDILAPGKAPEQSEAELKCKIHEQVQFVRAELGEGRVFDSVYFHLSLGVYVLRYEEKFGGGPFDENPLIKKWFDEEKSKANQEVTDGG